MALPRIIFVNRFYWPEAPATGQLLTDLAEALANSDYAVTVLTTGASTSAAHEIRNHVEIFRLTKTLRNRSLSGRAWDFITFVRATRRWLVAHLEKNDTLVTMTDPPMLGAAVDTVAEKRGVRHIHWIQDIFPEVAANVFRFRLLHGLCGWRDRAWKNAACCVVPGRQMGAMAARRGVSETRIACIPNWAPAGLTPVPTSTWRTHFALTGKFIVMYSGNLGRVHDFSSVVPLARRLREEKDLVFVFVGHGAQLDSLKAEVAAAHLPNVQFLPPVERDQLAETLSAGDVHLVSLRAGCEALVFPSKLYGIAAVGRPALVIGPQNCEVSQVVVENSWGEGFAPDDIDSMAKYILSLRGNLGERERRQAHALAFAASHSLETASASWRELLQSVSLAGAPTQSAEPTVYP